MYCKYTVLFGLGLLWSCLTLPTFQVIYRKVNTSFLYTPFESYVWTVIVKEKKDLQVLMVFTFSCMLVRKNGPSWGNYTLRCGRYHILKYFHVHVLSFSEPQSFFVWKNEVYVLFGFLLISIVKSFCFGLWTIVFEKQYH